MVQLKRKEDKDIENLGRVVVFGTPHIDKDHDNDEIVSAHYTSASVCEVLTVQDIFKDRIVTNKYVLPLADAMIHTSSEGTIYAYNCTLPYLQEVAHLAEVEQNIIMSQAFAYSGRVQPVKTPMFMFVLVGIISIFALIGMFK